MAHKAFAHDGVSIDGKDLRMMVHALARGTGGRTIATGLQVQAQSTPNNTVKVTAGVAIIPATGAGLGGSYSWWNDSDLTSPTFTATGGSPRKDVVIVRVTSGVAALEIVQGTPSGSPVEPTITGSNYLKLAVVTIPASTSTIQTSYIANTTTPWLPALTVFQAQTALDTSAQNFTNVAPNNTGTVETLPVTVERDTAVSVGYGAAVRSSVTGTQDWDGRFELRVDGVNQPFMEGRYFIQLNNDSQYIAMNGWVELTAGAHTLSLVIIHSTLSGGDVSIRDATISAQELRVGA